MHSHRIVVVGSYATGLTMKAARIPGAGETLFGYGYRVDFGGKGSNQAVGCARLGAQVRFIARVGKDNFGDMALQLYREEGVDAKGVRQSDAAPTGVGFIVVESNTGQNCIVLDPGANELLTAADVAQSLPELESASVLLTQLEIPAGAAASALAHGRKAGAITILNPAPVRKLSADVLGLVDVLTPNDKEAKVLAARDPEEAVEPEIVAQDLIRAGVRQVIITLGEKGALLCTSSTRRRFPAVRVQAVDTTGAGDAFNAGLAVALAHGDTIEHAVEFAIVTGAMAVMKEGVIPSLPRHGDVRQFCKTRGFAVPAWLRGRE